MRDPAEFVCIGGNLCIDFVNTIVVEHGERKDLLTHLSDVAAWGLATGRLDEAEAKHLGAAWGEREDSGAAFAHVQRFRSALHALVAGLARGKAADAAAISAINSELRARRDLIEIRQTASGFEKIVHADIQQPGDLLALVAESAADLVCFGTMARVKTCEGAECILYFYDTTKNHSRRWCSMAGCGNRAKVAAFYQRQRASTPFDG